MLGEQHVAAGDVEAVQVQVDDDDVGDLGAGPGQFGEAHVAHRAALAARALVARHADRLPRSVGGRPSEVGLIARPGGARPFAQPIDLDLGGRGELLDLELARCRRGLQLAHALHADVVAPALEHRPVERVTEVLLQEREVLDGELVLQCLGGGGHDDTLAAEHRRHEVPDRLAGAGAGLHDQVPLADDGFGNGLRHLLLAGSVFGSRERTP